MKKNVTIVETVVTALENEVVVKLRTDGKINQKDVKELCKKEGVRYIFHAVEKTTYEIEESAFNSFIISNGTKVAEATTETEN